MNKQWKEVDRTDEAQATCPWCGYVHADSWEFEDSGKHECHSCDKPIFISRHVEVTYVTTKRD